MLETKELRVRVTEEQHALIKTKAQLQGYNTLSAYVRDKLLRIPHKTEQRLLEIYNALMRREQ
jgi:uncharacterized protein (DUF1778 family)